LSLMLTHAPAGQHHAFEPIPHLADALRASFPSVRVHACALSDTAGLATFNYVVDVPGWSGLRRGNYDFRAALDQPRGSAVIRPASRVEEITVQVCRLDDVIPADTHVRFIKIDVEGAELQVLRGGLNTIQRCRPLIIFEYGEIHGAAYGTTPALLHDYLTGECGLECSHWWDDENA
jgi:FkbM family methyltransferase